MGLFAGCILFQQHIASVRPFTGFEAETRYPPADLGTNLHPLHGGHASRRGYPLLPLRFIYRHGGDGLGWRHHVFGDFAHRLELAQLGISDGADHEGRAEGGDKQLSQH
nr:hypothetical protein [Halomonas ilicicola]